MRAVYRRLRGRAPEVPGSAAWVNAEYDRQTVQVMARLLSSDSVCIDVGAHRGDILRHMVRLAPRARHHAFEPLPHLARHLRRRFPCARVHAAAVSDRSGTAEFLHVENDPGYSGLRRRVYDRDDPRIHVLEVATTTLDDAIPAAERIAFVKIDIEGGEYHALKGGIETIRRSRPVIVFEAGRRSTGQYGVTPEALFNLLSGTLRCDVSTMRRWLASEAPYSREAFSDNWQQGPDYYFIATPR